MLTPPEASPLDRHSQRMKRKKSVMDSKIDAAPLERGVFLIHTGVGKGKSCAAFGMLARALGHGLRCGVVQFIKGRSDTGEALFFRRFPEEIQFHIMGEGFSWETQDRARDQAAAAAAWGCAQAMLRDPAVGLVLLDELAIALKNDLLDINAVLVALAQRPHHQHVIVTGRGAPAPLIAAADTVTDMGLVKHAFAAGVKAQKGIEW